MTKNSLLYTEMVATGALLYGDKARFLDFSDEEHPIALQVGGHSPQDLAECARMAEQWGYDEINLNCGCPSDRVQSGKIGAILMAEPERVAECIRAMSDATSIPVTVKHRIGIDDMDDYEDMKHFVDRVAEAGCPTFIVHARKAWLKGLSPKENREIPPLNYDNVIRLKQEFPSLNIVINGGIKTIEQSQTLLEHVDGVMIGREAYNNPYFLTDIDHRLFEQAPVELSRIEVIKAFLPYCEEQLAAGVKLHHMTRHILGLFQGQARARLFRRHITENANRPGAGLSVIEDAMGILSGASSSDAPVNLPPQ